ncbi:MAG: nitrite/sulfite reductase, partial [Chloroflexota bacterium]
MTTAKKPVSSNGIVPYVPAEADEFQQMAASYQKGEIKDADFTPWRLRRGIYGQRQPDVQMVRVKIPGGILTADALDALGEVAEKYVPLRKGHITTRENIQYHHVLLEHAPDLMRLMGQAGLTTREACGNTVRNVVSCPLGGVCRNEVFDLTPYMVAYTRRFVRHPVTQNMPRKWKTSFSPCASDCANAPMHDLGFIAVVRDENGVRRKGFNMLVGGGTSIMPKYAQTLYEFVPVEDFLRVSEAALRVFNQANDLRKNKAMARVKVLV